MRSLIGINNQGNGCRSLWVMGSGMGMILGILLIQSIGAFPQKRSSPNAAVVIAHCRAVAGMCDVAHYSSCVEFLGGTVLSPVLSIQSQHMREVFNQYSLDHDHLTRGSVITMKSFVLPPIYGHSDLTRDPNRAGMFEACI